VESESLLTGPALFFVWDQTYALRAVLHICTKNGR